MSITKILAVAALVAAPVMASAGDVSDAGTTDNMLDDPIAATGSLGSSAGGAGVALAVGVLAVVAAAAAGDS